MIAWARLHRLSCIAALRRFAAAPLGTALNALVIGIALALPLGAYVVLENLQRAVGLVASEPQLSVFMALDAQKGDAERVEAELRQSGAVVATRFVSRDAALAELKRRADVGDVLAALKSNPLPDAFVVTLRPGQSAEAQRLAGALRALPKVTLVQLDIEWVQRLDAVVALAEVAVALLAGVLAFGLLAVTFNTIRLQILTQREEIEVSRLVGATEGYVRRPFLYQGALLGLLGGLAAFAIVGAVVLALDRQVAAFARTYGSGFHLGMADWTDLGAVLGFAVLLGWTGAYLCVSRYSLLAEGR